jgi:zinc protease
MKRRACLALALSLASCAAPAMHAADGPRDESWRNRQPSAAPGGQLVPPRVSSFALPNGLPVHVVEVHNLPLVAMKVVVRGGAASTAPRDPGLANLVADLIDDGAGARGAVEIAQEVESLGMSLSVETSIDYTSVTLDGMSDSLPEALDLLADLVQRPRFDDEEVAKAKQSLIARLERNAFDPFEVGLATLRQAIFGPRHPYAFVPLGTRKALQGFSRREIVAHHRSYWTPGNAALIVVGDVTTDDARRLIEPRFGAWSDRGGRSSHREDAAPPTEHRRRVLVVDMPKASQTMMMAGVPGIAQGAPDWAAVDVMNRVIGGSYASRLNLKMREEKGYTYAARSVLDRSRRPGLVYAAASVAVDKTEPALEDFWKILSEAGTQLPTAGEMEQARSTARSVLLGELETTRKTSDALARLLAFGLPLDWYGRVAAETMQVESEVALDAARRTLRPEEMTLVLVGPADRIGAALTKLDLGQPERVQLTAF